MSSWTATNLDEVYKNFRRNVVYESSPELVIKDNTIVDAQNIIDNLITRRKNRADKEGNQRMAFARIKREEERKKKEEEERKRKDRIREEKRKVEEEKKKREERLRKKKEKEGYFTDHVITGKLREILKVPFGTIKTKEKIYKQFNDHVLNLIAIYETNRRRRYYYERSCSNVYPYHFCSYGTEEHKELVKFLKLNNSAKFEFSPRKAKKQIGKEIIDKYIIEKKKYDEMVPWERPDSWEEGYGRTKPRKYILPDELINEIQYSQYNHKLLDFSRENNISLPKVSTSIGKIIAYMSNIPEDYCITKNQIEKVVTYCEINVKNKKKYITNEKIEKYKIKAGVSYIPDYYYIDYPYKLIE